MPRKFFYVCAGMLMLALSYHLGATTATAQAPGNVECVMFTDNSAWAVVDHHLIFLNNNGVHGDRGPLPTAAKAIACGSSGVVFEDGSAWQCNGPGDWFKFGQFPFSGPTPMQRQSWGQLKSRYR